MFELVHGGDGLFGNPITPRKFNIAPENRPSQKETHLLTVDLQGYVKLWGCKCLKGNPLMTILYKLSIPPNDITGGKFC